MKCKNDTKTSYKGDEPSPKGLGYCAHAECVGVVMKGLDGNDWVVKENSAGTKRWVKLGEKVEGSDKKKSVRKISKSKSKSKESSSKEKKPPKKVSKKITKKNTRVKKEEDVDDADDIDLPNEYPDWYPYNCFDNNDGSLDDIWTTSVVLNMPDHIIASKDQNHPRFLMNYCSDVSDCVDGIRDELIKVIDMLMFKKKRSPWL